MFLKKSIIIAFKRELIQLHVARSVCLVSLQQKKKSYETVHDFFPDGGHELDSQLGPHPFAPLPPPPSISPPSTLGILPIAGQHDGVIDRSASLPHPRGFWFLK